MSATTANCAGSARGKRNRLVLLQQLDDLTKFRVYVNGTELCGQVNYTGMEGIRLARD